MLPKHTLVQVLIAGSVIIICHYVPSVTSVKDSTCWALFSKTEASAFLSNGMRSTPKECCDELVCESRGSQCYTEQYRTYIKATHVGTCPPGKVVGVTSWCPGHYATVCTDICSVLSIARCENGGTCVPDGMNWHCNCQSGFSGTICQVDVDECSSNPCNAATSTRCDDLANDYFCRCSAGFTGKHCDIDFNECSSSPCQNGGRCLNQVAKYSCVCMPGYTGHQCETDVDECESSPCKNNATCNNMVNRYTCDCPPRLYGINCDTNICHPTPADVVFVLDSSISMTEIQFRKQLEFVANFTDHVIIGPRDFQVSVITYSFNATIEFYLNEYTDNVTLKDAIMNITYKPGATFTDKGLKAVAPVFSPGRGGDKRRVNNTMATRFVFLLTDGMSTDRHSTRAAARDLKKVVDKITVIGIGNQVSHQELLDIATRGDGSSALTANVYSVDNFNSLYTVVKQLVHYDCDECAHSSLSDVSIVIDKSHYITHAQYQSCLDAVQHLIDLLDLGLNKTHVSVTSFDKTITELIRFEDAIYSTTRINSMVNRQTKSDEKSELEISAILDFVGNNIVGVARPNARRFLLIFTNGIFKVNTVILQNKVAMLDSNDVITFGIGSGAGVSVEGLMSLVTDPFHVFLTDDSQTNLDVLRSEFVYNTCDLKGE